MMERHPVPSGYRWLLVTYPAGWRERNEAVVLDTLLEVHAETGRTAPSVSERIRFALDGLRIRVGRQHGAAHAWPAGALGGVHEFDQSNGVLPAEPVTDERAQTLANAAESRNSEELRVAAIAPAGLNAMGH